MRKIILLCAVYLLAGCSILNMARYNPNEHILINNIRTIAEVSEEKCTDKTKMVLLSSDLHFKALELYNFNSLVPENNESIAMSKSLLDISKGLSERYQKEAEVSAEYCKIKLKTIHDSAKAIEYVIVRKPK